LADGLGNTANDWVGDLDAEEALSWYGIYSLVMASIGIFGWMSLNGNYWVAYSAEWWYAHMRYYLPAGMLWWLLRFFDSEFLMKMTRIVTGLTVFGPFVEQWRSIGRWISVADNGYGYGDNGADSAYGDLWFWLGLVILSVTTLFEMIIQVTILGKVFEGIGEGDYYEFSDDEAFDL